MGGVPARPPLRLEATERRYVAGRGETCDLQLVSEEISREHAEIVRLWDGVVVNDLGSKNGVRVNDVVLGERRRLRDGDLIQIGPATLRLSDPADRYLRDFEARAPQVPRTEDEVLFRLLEPPLSAESSHAPSSCRCGNSCPLPAAALDRPAPAAARIREGADADARRGAPGGSRTAMVVAAVVLLAVGAVIVMLASRAAEAAQRPRGP